LGATPLFVDIESDGYLLSAQGVEQFLSERGKTDQGVSTEVKSGLRIKALLPVHLFGQCCAMNELAALARRFQLRMVEDVAQACGARVAIDGEEKFAGASAISAVSRFFEQEFRRLRRRRFGFREFL
jgi:dTDP-4-amino-4,6-dideoxygalactose transaminase